MIFFAQYYGFYFFLQKNNVAVMIDFWITSHVIYVHNNYCYGTTVISL